MRFIVKTRADIGGVGNTSPNWYFQGAGSSRRPLKPDVGRRKIIDMKIAMDDNYYAKLQDRVMDEIINTIIAELQSAEIPEEKMCELTADLAFSIGAIIDASRVMELEDGRPVLPFLSFALDEDRKEILVDEDGSYMHDDAYGKVYTIFDKV